jgi:hypothetical protein
MLPEPCSNHSVWFSDCADCRVNEIKTLNDDVKFLARSNRTLMRAIKDYGGHPPNHQCVNCDLIRGIMES